MCTFTFIPLKENGCIISTNRDESAARLSALRPQLFNIGNNEFYFPQDPVAGGTWIATSRLFTLCLLNGGKEKHQRKNVYHKSRGLVLLDILNGLIANDFTIGAPPNLSYIEPFTLFIYHHINKEFYQWVYSENELFEVIELNANEPFIHSSTTLYSPEMRALRAKWFWDFINTNEINNQGDIIKFHAETNTENKEFGLKIDRNGITKTLSLTSVLFGDNQHQMLYKDFIADEEFLLNCNNPNVQIS